MIMLPLKRVYVIGRVPFLEWQRKTKGRPNTAPLVKTKWGFETGAEKEESIPEASLLISGFQVNWNALPVLLPLTSSFKSILPYASPLFSPGETYMAQATRIRPLAVLHPSGFMYLAKLAALQTQQETAINQHPT